MHPFVAIVASVASVAVYEAVRPAARGFGYHFGVQFGVPAATNVKRGYVKAKAQVCKLSGVTAKTVKKTAVRAKTALTPHGRETRIVVTDTVRGIRS